MLKVVEGREAASRVILATEAQVNFTPTILPGCAVAREAMRSESRSMPLVTPGKLEGVWSAVWGFCWLSWVDWKGNGWRTCR